MSRQGSKESDAILNSTFELVNREFSNSPTFNVVKVNGIETDARILDGKTGLIKSMLLRPKALVNVGDYVEYNSMLWLVFDFNGETISPKATLQACNEIMKWKDVNGNIVQYPTLATATRNTKFDITSDKMQVEMLQAGIYAYLPYNEVTKEIRTSQRFIFGDRVYEISGTDDLTMLDVNRVGIIQFSCKITTISDKDDFVARIADNDAIYLSDYGLKKDESNENEGSGKLW